MLFFANTKKSSFFSEGKMAIVRSSYEKIITLLKVLVVSLCLANAFITFFRCERKKIWVNQK